MENEWIYIDIFDALPEVKFVHCDTRDFHVLCANEATSEKSRRLENEVRHRLRQENFLFRRDEILGCLKTLEQHTGGNGEWRHLRLKPSGHYKIGWLKYIRFVWTGELVDMGNRKERVYVAYADDCGTFTQLSREDLTPENLDNEHLNFMPYVPGRGESKPLPEPIKVGTLDELSNIL